MLIEVAVGNITGGMPHRLDDDRPFTTLGNRPSDAGRAALELGLDDPSPRVREASFWSLAVGHRADEGVRERLARALSEEPDARARADMCTSREQ